MLALIGGGTLFCCMLMWSIFRQGDASEETGSGGTDTPSVTTSNGQVISVLTTDKALSQTRRLLSARNASEIEDLLRPGDITPAEAIAYLHDWSVDHGAPGTLRWVGSVDCLSIPIEVVVIPYKDGKNRVVPFSPDETGQWQIDFDSVAAHSKPSISELAEGKGPKGRVRVMLSRDTYYNDLYSDESEWSCFAMRTNPTDPVIYGYCPREGDVMNALLAIEAKASAMLTTGKPNANKGRSRVVLDIERAPGAANKQVEIKRVISDDWVIPAVPFDEMIRARTSE